MNILVFIKIVSQQQFADTLNEQASRLASGNLIPNPADLYALELALRVKDKDPNTVITVLSMAPLSCEPELRSLLAMGADEAVLVADRKLAGSDTLATARALAAAVGKLPPQDLLLCGKKSLDSETGHIGPQLAVLLDLPLAANVSDFSCEDGLQITCLRDHSVQSYRGSYPAVLTVCNGTKMVRSPSILQMRRSRNKVVAHMDLETLELSHQLVGSAGSPTRVIRAVNISMGQKHGVVTQDMEQGVSQMLAAIHELGVTQ